MEGRLYEMGGMEFESLVDLVNFYSKHPLYRKVTLTYPIPREMIRRINTMDVSDGHLCCRILFRSKSTIFLF